MKITLVLSMVLAALCTSAASASRPPADNGASASVSIDKLADGLDHPWGMAFLPDGRLLVTERAGALRILGTDDTLSSPLEGTPKVFDVGQGGLLDVALDPQFADNSRIYLSFAEPGPGGASTALGRGRLVQDRIEGFEVIFRQRPKVAGPNHFGGRITISRDGTVFLAMGERFKFQPAQDLGNHLGTIVRLKPDGDVPEDNPFVEEPNAEDAIWTYGHRNIQAMAIDPATGHLWVAEMGPRDGDELNLIRPGRNYGWPVVSWGEHYDGRDIPDPPSHPRFADAALQWTPVIAPSGMAFYTGEAFADWRGSALIGGLVSKGLVRVKIDGRTAREVERIPLGARIRDVEQAPDGSVYVLTDQDDGNIWRLRPAR